MIGCHSTEYICLADGSPHACVCHEGQRVCKAAVTILVITGSTVTSLSMELTVTARNTNLLDKELGLVPFYLADDLSHVM